MPAVSPKQRIVAAIAEHNPSQLNPKNKGMASMSQSQLHDFASTKGLGNAISRKMKKKGY